MTDRGKAMERVKALLARTASDSEEEARTCALLACKMIQEHGFEIVDPKATGMHEVHADKAWAGSNPFAGKPPGQRPFGGGPFDSEYFSAIEDLLRNIGLDPRADGFKRRADDVRQRNRDRVDDFTAAYRSQAQEEWRARQEQVEEAKRRRQQWQEQERRDREHDNVRAAQAKKAKEEEAKRKKEEDDKKCPAAQPSAGPRYKKKDIAWGASPADFSHVCTGCGRGFREGDPVVWAAGFGTYRAECMEKLHDDFEFVPHTPYLVAAGTKKSSASPKKNGAPIFIKRVLWTKQYASAYDGKCRQCGKPFSAGDTIRWVRGFGSYHPVCWNAIPDDEELVPLDEEKAYTAVKEGCRGPAWKEAVENLKRAV